MQHILAIKRRLQAVAFLSVLFLFACDADWQDQSSQLNSSNQASQIDTIDITATTDQGPAADISLAASSASPSEIQPAIHSAALHTSASYRYGMWIWHAA